MRVLLLLLFSTIAFVMPSSATAEPCVVGDSTPATGLSPAGEIGFAIGPIYFLQDETPRVAVGEGNDDVSVEFGHWLYAETNGIPGLQRQDWRVDDTCRGAIEPDRWLL